MANAGHCHGVRRKKERDEDPVPDLSRLLVDDTLQPNPNHGDRCRSDRIRSGNGQSF